MNCPHPFGYEQHKLLLVGYTKQEGMKLGGDERVDVELGSWNLGGVGGGGGQRI